jgi:quinoprotein glucose dehydrogenase
MAQTKVAANHASQASGFRWKIGGGVLAIVLLAVLGWWAADHFSPMPLPVGEPHESRWDAWGSTPGGTRYADIGQIRPDNVAHLKLAWSTSTGELVRRSASMLQNGTNETTPILVAGSLISCTPYGRIVALDPGTGALRWSFDSRINPNFHVPDQYICRGVSQWTDARAPDGPCGTRILMSTVDLKLWAIDARSGRPCEGFGQHGWISISTTIPEHHPGEVKPSSPPAIVGDVAVLGSMVLDNVRALAPRGIIDGFDVRTGKLLWSFDPIPQDNGPGPNDWLDDARHHAGAANMWSVASVDPQLGLVYIPTGSASPDYYGGLRPGDNRYANSIVALNGATGKVVWSRQFVHHDIWDYDTPAQPTLIDIDRPGGKIPALVQPTKQGFLFVLDRRTGAPLFPIREVPVPQGAMPGERLSPTQPMPVLPKPLFDTKLTPDRAFGFTPWDRKACRDLIRASRNEGLFTPISTQGTITYPAASGGANWGGGAVDPVRQIYYVNSSRVASRITLLPRHGDASGSVKLSSSADISPMAGTPYEVKREWLVSPWGAPCTPPPWGGLSAIDLRTGQKLWDVPLGTINFKLPVPLPFDLTYGSPNIGGPVATRGGVLFIAATMDRYLRAIDMATGRELWRAQLPGGSQATPMTYMWKGRQYVVMATGQHMWFQTKASDQIVAYALPIHPGQS